LLEPRQDEQAAQSLRPVRRQIASVQLSSTRMDAPSASRMQVDFYDAAPEP
jgi:hypothetical protein